MPITFGGQGRSDITFGGRSIQTERLTGLANVGGALLTGARQDPIIKPIIDVVAKLGGVDEETLDQLAGQLQNSRLTDAMKFAGEWGPTLAAGMGMYSLGKAGARALLVAAGKNKATTTGLGAAAARLTTKAGVTPPPLRMTQRAFEIAGGGLGFGTYEGARTMAETGNLHEAARDALVAAGFSIGLEGAITAVGAKVFKAFEIDPAKKFSRFQEVARPIALEQIEKSKQAAIKLTRQAEAALGAGQQADELLMKASQKLNEVEALENFVKPRTDIAYFTEGYFEPGSVTEVIARVSAQVLRTPESFKGRGSVALSQFLEMASEAVPEQKAIQFFANKTLGAEMANISKAIGRDVGKNKKLAADIVDGWELNDLDGIWAVLSKMGRSLDDARAVKGSLDEIERVSRELQNQISAMGGAPVMTEQVMRNLGVRHYVPHRPKELPGATLLEKIQRAQERAGNEPDIVEAAKLLRSMHKPTFKQRASQDFNRIAPGSLRQKAAFYKEKDLEGIIEEDAFRAMFLNLNEAAHRIAWGKRFGFRGELQETITAMAAREGDSTALVTSLMDGVLGNKYYDMAMRKLADTVLAGQIGSKMTLGVLPNFTQPINTILFTNMKNTFSGMRRGLRHDETEAILQMTGFIDSAMTSGLPRVFGREAFREAKTGIKGLDYAGNVMDWWAWATLKFTGFSSVEKWNRVLSGGAGISMYKDVTAKALKGKLKGDTLNMYRRKFHAIGLDLDDIVRKMKDGNWSGEMDLAAQTKAAFRTAQATQFMPSSVRRPLSWNHPLGRAVFQFKNFALGQTRFLRDAVLKETANGNPRPLAYFLSIYPVAGEFVRDAKAIIKDKPREDDGLARFLQNVLAVGGVGLASDLVLASKFGRLGDSLLGPSISDTFQFIENFVRADAAGEFDRARRMPFYQVGAAMARTTYWGAEEINAYIDALEEARDGGGSSFTSVDQLRFDRARNK